MAQLDLRRKIKVTGKESLADVARAVFKDPRVASLLSDLNPSLPKSGPLSANAVVMCPSKAEAMAWAKKLNITLGFDEKATNGTRQKRAWAKLQGPGQASHAGIDPVEAARKLLEQKVSAQEVGKRLVKLCTPERLDAFLQAAPPPDLNVVHQVARVHQDYPRARARLLACASVLDATLRPAGLLSLLQAYVHDAAATQALMNAIIVPAPLQEQVSSQAKRTTALVARAKELNRIERGARDASIVADKENAAVLTALCAALADKIEPVSGERLASLGLADAWEKLSAHLTQLRDTLKRHDEPLGRAPPELISAIANGTEGAAFQRPWPLIARVVRGLKDPLDKAPVSQRDAGLGGLVPTPAQVAAAEAIARGPTIDTESGVVARPRLSMEGGPVLSAASLQARAASGAKSSDEGSAIAERLASSVCALTALARPVAGDAGPAPMRRARRKAHFDDVMIARGAPQGEAIARLVDEIFADARRVGHSGVERVSKQQQQAARDVSTRIADGITLHQKPSSELARAVVVVAFAIDRELGGLLLRPTGREAFRSAVEKHGGKLLSKAALTFAEPPKTTP